MLKILLLLLTTQVMASDDYRKSEGRKIFVGPSFKIWCSLTNKGSQKVGTKMTLTSDRIIQFPKGKGDGELPSLVIRDLSRKDQVSKSFFDMKIFCKEELKDLSLFINKKLQIWMGEKVPLISVRVYDEILWDFYKDRFKNDQKEKACQIRHAYNVKNMWVLTYPQKNIVCF